MSASVRIDLSSEPDAPPDPQRLARQAKLRYVSDSDPGFSRRRCGKGFAYFNESGRPLNGEHRERIDSLVIPPAWREVWICPQPNGHIQAIGRDDLGRKQYRYHERWTRAANWVKFSLLRPFGHELPRIRRRIRRDLSDRDDRVRTLALMAELLDATAIRVGGREYAEKHEHYGLTTLLDEHVTIRGDVVRFEFVGKSGKEREVEFKDRLLAARVKDLLGRKGVRLFEVKSDDGSLVPADAEHLNTYLRPLMPSGCTAKTFRTWHGTVAAFEVLDAACECRGSIGQDDDRSSRSSRPGLGKTAIQKTLRESIKAAAMLLGNTPAVCKSSYVHPALSDLYAEQQLADQVRKLRPKSVRGLKRPEQRLLALLDRIERLG